MRTIGPMTYAVSIAILASLTLAVGIRLFCILFLVLCGLATFCVASGSDVAALVIGVGSGHW